MRDYQNFKSNRHLLIRDKKQYRDEIMTEQKQRRSETAAVLAELLSLQSLEHPLHLAEGMVVSVPRRAANARF